MTTADDAFLAAIRDSPADDTRRLAYADYLDERNDPRGRFVRLQYALQGVAPARTVADVERDCADPYKGCCERHADRTGCDCLAAARAAEAEYGGLWAEVAALCDYRWVAAPLEKVGLGTSGYQLDYPGWVGDVIVSPDERFPAGVSFARGFPDRLVVPVQSFLRHAGKFFSAFPLTRVVFRDAWPVDAADRKEKRAGVLAGPLAETDPLYSAARLADRSVDRVSPPDRPHTTTVPRALVCLPDAAPAGLRVRPEDQAAYAEFDFPTVAAARDWLSAAAVHYGRSGAGLPPLR